MSYIYDIKYYIMINNKSEKFNIQQQELAEYGKIFSHPARIAIINLLAEKKEIKTGDISHELPISRTTVFQHLKILKEFDLIKGNIDGLKIHYCLNTERLKEIKEKFILFFETSIHSFKCDC